MELIVYPVYGFLVLVFLFVLASCFYVYHTTAPENVPALKQRGKMQYQAGRWVERVAVVLVGGAIAVASLVGLGKGFVLLIQWLAANWR